MTTVRASSPASSPGEVVALRLSRGPVASVQGALALDLVAREEPPPRPRLRSARALDLVEVDTASRERTDAFVGRYLQAVVEIGVGDRPVSQVLRHTVPEVYDDLVVRSRAVASVAASAPTQRRGAGSTRPVLRGVRTALVRDDAVEASAHVRYGRRSRAVAARFEVVRGRWQCVALVWG